MIFRIEVGVKIYNVKVIILFRYMAREKRIYLIKNITSEWVRI